MSNDDKDSGGARLRDGQADLWLVYPDTIANPAILGRYRALLTPSELQRLERFRFAKGRHEYLVTRALVRTVLSRYVSVAPEDWRFVANRYGRPEIGEPKGLLPLRFNLSHTDGLIACLVAMNVDVGVDVEDMHKRRSTVEIADRFFAPSEVAALHALPREAQRRRFFQYWTLKEAYIKARGMGLALPLGEFAFDLGTPGSIGISFGARITDEPDDWQFCLQPPSDRHMLAFAARKGAGIPFRVILRETTP